MACMTTRPSKRMPMNWRRLRISTENARQFVFTMERAVISTLIGTTTNDCCKGHYDQSRQSNTLLWSTGRNIAQSVTHMETLLKEHRRCGLSGFDSRGAIFCHSPVRVVFRRPLRLAALRVGFSMHKDASTERSVSFHALFVRSTSCCSYFCATRFVSVSSTSKATKPPFLEMFDPLVGRIFCLFQQHTSRTAVPPTVTIPIVRGGPDGPDSCSLTCLSCSDFPTACMWRLPTCSMDGAARPWHAHWPDNRECQSRRTHQTLAALPVVRQVCVEHHPRQEITKFRGDANLERRCFRIHRQFIPPTVSNAFFRGDVGFFGQDCLSPLLQNIIVKHPINQLKHDVVSAKSSFSRRCLA